MLNLFARRGQVLEIEEVGPAFRVITIGSEALRTAEWTPGDKVQISLGGWAMRTFTPIEWDAENGRTRIIVYLHAGGPGAEWARALKKGDECVAMGPRRSLDLTQLATSAILFGDETSIGLASALLSAVRPSSAHLLFEVSSLANAQPALARFGLEHSLLGERAENDEHLDALEERLRTTVEAMPSANIVLSGKASSAQRMRKLLKRLDIPMARLHVKAYWATGKTGLD